MSNRLFQGVIHQMKNIIDRVIGVIDETGAVISCNELGRIGEIRSAAASLAFSSNDIVRTEGMTLRTFGDQIHAEYAVFVEGVDEEAEKYTQILCVSFGSLKQYFDEKFDKGNFIKNVILDNILPGDIYLKARELRFNNEATRVVLLIRVDDANDIAVFDLIQSLFPDKGKDFVLSINETDVALVKEVNEDIEPSDLEKLARSIADALSTEVFAHCYVGIGTMALGVKELARSFKEAQVSLEVSKVFDTEKTIVSYDHLGIARLIYQLPQTLCDMFLREVFKRGSIECLDSETLFTIQKFFENNLNVSETSRKLFVHRNTLVYRLEKIRKLTGLDLREFDDAIVFKVALMVKKYMDARPVKY